MEFKAAYNCLPVGLPSSPWPNQDLLSFNKLETWYTPIFSNTALNIAIPSPVGPLFSSARHKFHSGTWGTGYGQIPFQSIKQIKITDFKNL